MKRRPTILCIDDNHTGLITRKALLTKIGYDVLTAEDAVTGLAVFRANHGIDAAVLDYNMPGMNGEALATIFRNERPDLPILLLSGFPDDLLGSRLESLVDAVVIKGEPPQVLLTALERLTGTKPERSPVISPAIVETRKLREQAKALRAKVRCRREAYHRRKSEPPLS